MKLRMLKPRLAHTVAKPERQSAAARGYGHQWREARQVWLSQHPLCVFCEAVGRVTAASVVDHVIPHRGDARLFWDRGNWQSLCASCHSSTKQAQEAAEIYGR